MPDLIRQYAAEVVGQLRTWTSRGRREAPEGSLYIVAGQTDSVNRANEVIDAGAFGRQEGIPLEAWGHNRALPNDGRGVLYESGNEILWDGQMLETEAARQTWLTIDGNGKWQEYSLTFRIEDAYRDANGRLHITQATALGVAPVYQGISLGTRTIRMQGETGMTPEERAQLEATLRSYGWSEERIRQYMAAIDEVEPAGGGQGGDPAATPSDGQGNGDDATTTPPADDNQGGGDPASASTGDPASAATDGDGQGNAATTPAGDTDGQGADATAGAAGDAPPQQTAYGVNINLNGMGLNPAATGFARRRRRWSAIRQQRTVPAGQPIQWQLPSKRTPRRR